MKSVKIISGVLCGLIALSCTKEIEQGSGSFIQFASVEDALTKTEWNGSDIVWSSDEYARFGVAKPTDSGITLNKVYASNKGEVSNEGASIVFSLPAGDSFTGTFTNDANCFFYGFYPKTANGKGGDTDPELPITIPSAQTMTAVNGVASFDKSADILFGQSYDVESQGIKHYQSFPDSSVPMLWRRQVGHGRFRLLGIDETETVASVKYQFTGANMTGEFTPNYINQSITASNAKDYVEISGDIPFLADKSVDTWFCSAPFSVEPGTTLNVLVTTNESYYEKSITLPSKIDFAQNACNTLSIDLSSNKKPLQEKVLYILSFTQVAANSAYDASYEIECNNLKWSVQGNLASGNVLRIGGKALDKADRSIVGKNVIDKSVSKIVVSHNGRTKESLVVNSVKVVAASNDVFSSDLREVTIEPVIEVNEPGSFAIALDSEVWPANRYYKFIFNVSNSATSKSYALEVTSISFYHKDDDAESGETTIAAPTFTPAGGQYTGKQTITLASEGAEMIMYTTDGTIPSYANSVGEMYDEKTGISIYESCTIKAIAIDADENSSSVASATYEIIPKVGKPSFSLASGSYYSTQSVTISCDGAEYIYYTTDGTDPGTSSTPQISGYKENPTVTVSQDCTIRAIAYIGAERGAEATASYIIKTVPTYASLADLIVAGKPTTAGTPVNVTLTNECITKIASNRHGVYLSSDTQEVEIYCDENTIDASWLIGGTVSGTISSGKWLLYVGSNSETWELKVDNWNAISYKAPEIAIPSYNSLKDLVDAGSPTTDGSYVTVTLSNEEIIRTANNSIFLKSGDQEVQIYYTGINNNKMAGGKISGTLTNSQWLLYSEKWELMPSSVDGITYTPPYFTVSFNVGEHGTAPESYTNVAGGSTITAPTAPTADGYTFSGWYKEEALTNEWVFATDKVTDNITLYAKWTSEGSKTETTYTEKEFSFKVASASLSSGLSTNGTFNSSYYKMTAGQYAKIESSALFPSDGEELSSDMVVNVACGTFNTWNGAKTITFNVAFYDNNDKVLTTSTYTTGTLNSTQGTYRGDITLTKPDDPSSISYLKITFQTLTTGTTARLAGVKVSYKTLK